MILAIAYFILGRALSFVLGKTFLEPHCSFAALDGQESFITTMSTEQIEMDVANVIGLFIFLAFVFMIRIVIHGRSSRAGSSTPRPFH